MSKKKRAGIRMVPVNTHNRNACGILRNIRDMIKVANYTGLEAAVEELQEMYQNMEDALYFYDSIGYDLEEIGRLEESKRDLKREIKKLRAKEWIIRIGKDPNPKEDDQDLYNLGYLDAMEEKDPKKKDEDE